MATTDNLKIRLFISHSWKDKQIADRLARDLEPFADVWMDWRALRPGDPIQNTIDDVLRDIDVVLVVWTASAAGSKGMDDELRTAHRLGLRIVPCLFSHDDDGNPHPPFTGVLAENQLLGVNFHHHDSGTATIAKLIVDLQREQLPEEASMDAHPGTRLLGELQAYLAYLANYRKLRGGEDQRSYYVNRIIEEIERYVESGGDRTLVHALLQSSRQSDVDDREGIGMLTSRLEQLLSDEAAPERAAVPAADDLTQRVAQVVPAGTAEAWLSKLDTYIETAPTALQAMTTYAWSQQSQAGAQVTGYLQNYLDNPDDLIPDRIGRFGMIDDSWMILNTAFRLVEGGLLPAEVVPYDWRTLIEADHVARAIMPPPVLAALLQMVEQMMQVIAAEVATYQPWFTPQGNGYAPVFAEPSSTGGCWEDQMNEALLGTGLSV